MCRMTFSFNMMIMNMMMIMMCRNRMTFPLFNLMMMMKIMIMMCRSIFPFFSMIMVCGGGRWIGHYTDMCMHHNGECGGFFGAGRISKHLKGRSGPRVGKVFGPNIPKVVRNPALVRFLDRISQRSFETPHW